MRRDISGTVSRLQHDRAQRYKPQLRLDHDARCVPVKSSLASTRTVGGKDIGAGVGSPTTNPWVLPKVADAVSLSRSRGLIAVGVILPRRSSKTATVSRPLASAQALARVSDPVSRHTPRLGVLIAVCEDGHTCSHHVHALAAVARANVGRPGETREVEVAQSTSVEIVAVQRVTENTEPTIRLVTATIRPPTVEIRRREPANHSSAINTPQQGDRGRQTATEVGTRERSVPCNVFQHTVEAVCWTHPRSIIRTVVRLEVIENPLRLHPAAWVSSFSLQTKRERSQRNKTPERVAIRLSIPRCPHLHSGRMIPGARWRLIRMLQNFCVIREAGGMTNGKPETGWTW